VVRLDRDAVLSPATNIETVRNRIPLQVQVPSRAVPRVGAERTLEPHPRPAGSKAATSSTSRAERQGGTDGGGVEKDADGHPRPDTLTGTSRPDGEGGEGEEYDGGRSSLRPIVEGSTSPLGSPGTPAGGSMAGRRHTVPPPDPEGSTGHRYPRVRAVGGGRAEPMTHNPQPMWEPDNALSESVASLAGAGRISYRALRLVTGQTTSGSKPSDISRHAQAPSRGPTSIL